MNRSADLQSAYRSKTEISHAVESRLQIGAPVHGERGLWGIGEYSFVEGSMQPRASLRG